MLSDNEIIQLMDDLIDYQRERVWKIARRLNPSLTAEDIRNPHDYPEVSENPHFNFEDGILSGYVSARVALITEIRKKEQPPDDTESSTE